MKGVNPYFKTIQYKYFTRWIADYKYFVLYWMGIIAHIIVRFGSSEFWGILVRQCDSQLPPSQLNHRLRKCPLGCCWEGIHYSQPALFAFARLKHKIVYHNNVSLYLDFTDYCVFVLTQLRQMWVICRKCTQSVLRELAPQGWRWKVQIWWRILRSEMRTLADVVQCKVDSPGTTADSSRRGSIITYGRRSWKTPQASADPI